MVFVEIGNRKNRENDHFDLQMTPIMHKISAYFRYISWCKNLIRYPNSQNEYEKHFKQLIERIDKYGGRVIVSGGDYGVNFFRASELRDIAEDINNIWYWHDKMHPCNIKWKDNDILETEKLIKKELKEINPEYLSRSIDVKLISDISSDIYLTVYQPIEYETFKHEAYLNHYGRMTTFVSVAVTIVLLVLCSMLFLKLPIVFLQFSTVLIVLFLLISLLLLGIEIKKQIIWYNRFKKMFLKLGSKIYHSINSDRQQ